MLSSGNFCALSSCASLVHIVKPAYSACSTCFFSRPNVVFHQLNGGRTIVFRATQRISVGEEASYSYLSSACVPFRERRRLLYDGFLIRLPNVAAATPRHRLDQDLTAPAQSIDAAQVSFMSNVLHCVCSRIFLLICTGFVL